jgi:hypothetical protein
MRFALAALMTLFLAGSLLAQDAPSAQEPPAAQDGTSAQDATQSPSPEPAAAPAADQSADQPAPPPPAEAAPPPPPPAPNNAFAFTGGINLGSDVILSGPGNSPETWTRLGFQPDFSFGKIGIGLDLTFHFILYKTSDKALTIYPGDWIPSGGKNVFDVYLPKLLYVRYGLKGEDPFFAKLGSIDDLSLGNGFIMSNYSNMHWMPQQRIFGLDLGLDGALFGVPYVGIEALTGNLARLDVVGGRLFARPLIGTSIPVLKNMQVGATFVTDTQPDLYNPTATAAKAVSAFGADITLPILGGKAFPLVGFTDVAMDPNQSAGWMIGGAGRLLGLFTYGAQLRILQNGFIPSYFDANYDIFRAQKFDQMQLPLPGGVYEGWFATLGTSLFKDIFVFNMNLDGPFKAPVIDPLATNQSDYPHLRGVVRLNQVGSFPFFFDASYDKYFIGAVKGFFDDLVDPTSAVIGLDLNYKTGASVLTLAYDAKWDPTAKKFNVTSSLQASMKF